MKENSTNPTTTNIIECISVIVSSTEEFGLCKELFQNTAAELEYITKMMDITERQALIFSLFVNEGIDGSVSLSEFSSTFRCKKIELLSFLNDIKELEKKYLINFIYKIKHFCLIS